MASTVPPATVRIGSRWPGSTAAVSTTRNSPVPNAAMLTASTSSKLPR